VSPKRLVLALIAGLAAALALAAPASAAYDAHLDLPYDLNHATTPLNRLDLYTPTGAAAGDNRPLVVYVHGGGWIRGDKSNRIADKAELFTSLGYVFASVNYRLSPDPPDTSDAARIRFPAQPADVGEAIGWLDRHVGEYGGDPERILLVGHSAGAQLVSLIAADSRYIRAFAVFPWQIMGAVSLDTDAFDIAQQAAQTENLENRTLIWNAFATPAENAAIPAYYRASAVQWASAGDAPFLLVTGRNPSRIAANQAMATALKQDPAGVLSLPYTHEQINTALGGPGDTAGETAAVTDFMDYALTAAVPPTLKLTRTPGRKVHVKGRKATVRFRFEAKKGIAASYECRLDDAEWTRCKPPKRYRLAPGAHTFRGRGIGDRGRIGPNKSYRFRVVRR